MSPTRYADAAGTVVEVIVIAGAPRPGGERRSPVPVNGPQLRITRHGFITGYCPLAELGSHVDLATLEPVK